MIAALALALSLQQDPAVLDAPAWESASWRVSLPRPFDDWIFAPATSHGTTTVIFQPRSGALSDQLWGVLILTRWGGPVPLAGVADRRLRQTWRPVLGSAYTLLARDSLTFGGWPAMHLAMTGAIAHAVLDVEEYLVARGRDLIVLQLRFPRGVPRDSIAAGYRRVIEGLRLGGVLGWFWWMRGYMSEGRERLQALLAQSGYEIGASEPGGPIFGDFGLRPIKASEPPATLTLPAIQNPKSEIQNPQVSPAPAAPGRGRSGR